MRTIKELEPEHRRLIAGLYAVASFFTMIIGWAYLPFTKGPAELPSALVFATKLVPIWVFGIVWLIVGTVGLYAAAVQLRKGIFAISIGGQGGMHLIWFGFYVWAYFSGDQRAYVGAVLYGMPVCLFAIMAILIAVLRPKVTTKHG